MKIKSSKIERTEQDFDAHHFLSDIIGSLDISKSDKRIKNPIQLFFKVRKRLPKHGVFEKVVKPFFEECIKHGVDLNWTNDESQNLVSFYFEKIKEVNEEFEYVMSLPSIKFDKIPEFNPLKIIMGMNINTKVFKHLSPILESYQMKNLLKYYEDKASFFWGSVKKFPQRIRQKFTEIVLPLIDVNSKLGKLSVHKIHMTIKNQSILKTIGFDFTWRDENDNTPLLSQLKNGYMTNNEFIMMLRNSGCTVEYSRKKRKVFFFGDIVLAENQKFENCLFYMVRTNWNLRNSSSQKNITYPRLLEAVLEFANKSEWKMNATDMSGKGLIFYAIDHILLSEDFDLINKFRENEICVEATWNGMNCVDLWTFDNLKFADLPTFIDKDPTGFVKSSSCFFKKNQHAITIMKKRFKNELSTSFWTAMKELAQRGANFFSIRKGEKLSIFTYILKNIRGRTDDLDIRLKNVVEFFETAIVRCRDREMVEYELNRFDKEDDCIYVDLLFSIICGAVINDKNKSKIVVDFLIRYKDSLNFKDPYKKPGTSIITNSICEFFLNRHFNRKALENFISILMEIYPSEDDQFGIFSFRKGNEMNLVEFYFNFCKNDIKVESIHEDTFIQKFARLKISLPRAKNDLEKMYQKFIILSRARIVSKKSFIHKDIFPRDLWELVMINCDFVNFLPEKCEEKSDQLKRYKDTYVPIVIEKKKENWKLLEEITQFWF